MKLSRQEYWSQLPFPSPGNIFSPRIKPWSPALQADSLPTELQIAEKRREVKGKGEKEIYTHLNQFSSVQVLIHVQLLATPGFPVHHQLPEPAQTHVHRVGDVIQPSQPLSSLSPPDFYLSQHQGLFQ